MYQLHFNNAVKKKKKTLKCDFWLHMKKRNKNF